MESLLNRDMTLGQIMHRWPQTVRAAIRSGILCAGCPIAPFHTVSDAAREHGLDEAALRRVIEAAASLGADGTVRP
jgi:hybrid cluster-associated redox disulfide protein